MKGTEMRNRKAKKKGTLAFDESGATAIVVALIFSAICGVGGLALDFGHYYKVQAELQRTADAGALAGVTGLIPYTGSAPGTPNWPGGQTAANIIIDREQNKVDAPIITPTAIVDYGYWYLKAPTGTTQALPQARPTTEAWLPEPAIKVTLSKDVTMYLAPLIGFAGPLKATATAIAILPEIYAPTGVPPIAVSEDIVYDESKVVWEVDTTTEYDNLKIQEQGGKATWINLDGGNSVPSVNIAAPLIAGGLGSTTGDLVHTVPGTKAVLTDYITAGEIILVPVLKDGFAEKDPVTGKFPDYVPITTWAAFKVDPPPDGVGANYMSGKFIDIGFFPKQQPGVPRPTTTTPMVWGTPKIVSPQ
jgi:Putative Flp pilus-assembly TadE/G-like/Putative Tad-like Flp pilus-assembly